MVLCDKISNAVFLSSLWPKDYWIFPSLSIPHLLQKFISFSKNLIRGRDPKKIKLICRDIWFEKFQIFSLEGKTIFFISIHFRDHDESYDIDASNEYFDSLKRGTLQNFIAKVGSPWEFTRKLQIWPVNL